MLDDRPVQPVLLRIAGTVWGASAGGLVAIPGGMLLAVIASDGRRWVGVLVALGTIVAFTLLGGWIGLTLARRFPNYTTEQCQACGYLLRGSSGGACPECGHPT